MAIKKNELYSSLWASCNELRGGMDASQYKDYVLTLLFMKYVSDKYKGDPYGMIVVPKGASFDDMAALKGDKEIGEKINKIISALAEENAARRSGIFMIDASKGFMKDGNKNRLRAQDIHKVAANDYNLNIPRYIDSSEPEDLHDLSAHLRGGIPKRDIDALQGYWQVFPSLRSTLFAEDRPGYCKALILAAQVKTTILNHPEFTAFARQSLQPFTDWCERAALQDIQPGEQPKAIIESISEDLLQAYTDSPLLSKYDVYQILMDYWAETMQDDVYVLVQDGWLAGKTLRELVAQKGEKLKELPDLVINKSKYKAELIPPALLVARYFQAEQASIDQLHTDLDAASQELESYIEEHSGDEGLLSDALNDKDKVTAASVKARLKLTTDFDEKAALKQAQKLFDAELEAKKSLKEHQDALDLKVFKQYAALREAEIKILIVEDKWLTSLQTNTQAEIKRVTQQLANRVKELEERYAEPLPVITQSVDVLSEKVAEHLKAMGLEWEL
jgi:type I restriction enzyme M protein